MKKSVFLLAVLGLLMLTCSKKNITNNYYYGPEEEAASIVGVVYPPESEATVTAYLGIPVASTQIDTSGYFKLSSLYAGTYSLMVEAPGYFDCKLSAKLSVSANTTVSVDTIYLTSIHDLVSGVRPYDGTEDVDPMTPILILFRNLMDHESVENAFHIDPTAEGDFEWLGTKPSLSPPFLIFTPRELLMTNMVYHVTIDTSASDTSGMKLAKSYQFHFTTEPVRVRSTYPADKDTWAAPLTEIRISFNSLMNMESVNSAFRLLDSRMNEVSGDLSWPDAASMRFRPSSALAAKETYTGFINSGAEDASGNRMPEEYWFYFVTQPVLVSYSFPTSKSPAVSTHTYIVIRFNTEMDAESVNLAFRLLDSQLEQVEGSFFWDSPYQVSFRPNSLLRYNETYTVTIGTTAKDLYGTNLDEPFTLWFKTMSE